MKDLPGNQHGSFHNSYVSHWIWDVRELGGQEKKDKRDHIALQLQLDGNRLFQTAIEKRSLTYTLQNL